MLPFILPAILGGATFGLNEWQRSKRLRELKKGFDRARPPSIDFGLRRKGLMQRAGDAATGQSRAYGASQESAGVVDPGAAFSASRAIGTDVGKRVDEGMIGIQGQEDAYKRALAEWEAARASAIAGQPDMTNSLAEGLQTGMSAYMGLNPQQFLPQAPQVQADKTTDFTKLPGFDPRFAQPRFNALGTNQRRGLQFQTPRRPTHTQWYEQ